MSYFCVCKLWVLPLKKAFDEMLKYTQLLIVLTEPKNMPFCHIIFHCELFPWFIFLAECKILNFVDVGRRTLIASLRGWPLARCQSNDFIRAGQWGHGNFFIEKFCSINIQLSVHCPETSCTIFITIADLQTFDKISVFNGKTHNLQMRKYDVSRASPVEKNI